MKAAQSQILMFMVCDMDHYDDGVEDAFRFEESRELAREAIKEEEERRQRQLEPPEPLSFLQNVAPARPEPRRLAKRNQAI